MPFLDDNNELLDDVGRAERQEVHETYERNMGLGELAVENKNTRSREERAREMRQKIASFQSQYGSMKEAQAMAGAVNRGVKGEAFDTSVPPQEGIRFDKTHIPKTETATPRAETGSKEWSIGQETSAGDIAKQAVEKIVPAGSVVTPEKMNEFSNKVKRELAKKRILPDVDSRAKEAYAAVDDKLMEMRDNSRTAA